MGFSPYIGRAKSLRENSLLKGTGFSP
jgi:hypothetical protein